MKLIASCVLAVAFVVGALSVAGSSEIAPGVRFVPGMFEPGHQPDGNSVVFETEAGVIVVDTGRHESHTRALLEIVEASGYPPVAIVNTHWHLDHVSGNALFRATYPDVAVYGTKAVEGAREGFLASYRKQLVEMIAKTEGEDAKRGFEDEIARIDAGDAFVPSEPVGAARTIEIGGRALELHVTSRAVTEADLWLFDPESKVLVAGDLVTLPAPFLDTACPDGWLKALDELARSDFDTLVPGHGTPMGRDSFERYRTAFGTLVSCSRGDGAVPSCVDGWIEDAGPLLEADEARTRAMVEYYVELLRSARLERNCR